MANANDVKNKKEEGHYANSIIGSRLYPEVSVTVVNFLHDEVQIEQGFSADPINLNPGSGNSIISISDEQALELAHFIINTLEGK